MVSRLSIIVPMLDEAASIAATLSALAVLRHAGAEVIVVDGGSTDGSIAAAAGLADRILTSARGRARQMNAGAAVAEGEVLLFLHADTRLPVHADELIRGALAGGGGWGRFDVRIEGRSAWFPIIAGMMNLRSRWSGIATGDQAIFVRRELFMRLGGFAELPLMEDVELCIRLRRVCAPTCIAAAVTTSGRRWEKHGVLTTIVLMWWLRARFALGADPAALARAYGYAPTRKESRDLQ